MSAKDSSVKYPGIPEAADGNTAVILCERESSDAAGAYPITPSTQMGEYWAAMTAAGHINISGRPLIFIEPEGEHAAAGVTAGMLMSGFGVAVIGMIRENTVALYPATLAIRGYFCICLVVFYWMTLDPMFLILTMIVLLGFVLTLSAYLIDRRMPSH